MKNKTPKTQRKILPILIFLVIGICIMYFGLVFKSGCVNFVPQQCDWWNVICMGNNVVGSQTAGLGQVACLAQENIYRMIFLLCGAFVTIIAITKY